MVMNSNWNGSKRDPTEFSYKKIIRDTLLKELAESDQYLYDFCNQLDTETSPRVRKRFNPVPMDNVKSYGLISDELTDEEGKSLHKTIYKFNYKESQNILVDNYDSNLIDKVKTTAYHNSAEGGFTLHPIDIKENKIFKTFNKSPWCTIDKEGNPVQNQLLCNEYWYIGFDKNRQYETRPNWLMNQENNEIPSVCRAQTFKPEVSGELVAVTLNISSTNGDVNNWASPLIVEILPTHEVKIGEKVDSETKKNEDVKIAFPGKEDKVFESSDVLARQYVEFNTNQPQIYTVVFDIPVSVTEGSSYAICLRSPLSHNTHAPMIGGWSKPCFNGEESKIYHDGCAFVSYNNARDWELYGTEDVTVDYHQGTNKPFNFAFEAQIRQTSKSTEYGLTPEYVYLKPIRTNPIKEISLGYCSDEGTSIEYEYFDLLKEEWVPFKKEENYRTPVTGEPTIVLIRAKLSTLDSTSSPVLKSINVNLKTRPAKEAVLTTVPYTPPYATVLGATVWGAIYAPYYLKEDSECSVDIVNPDLKTKRINLINNKDILDYADYKGAETIIDKKVLEDLISKGEKADWNKYFNDNSKVLPFLHGIDVYVIGQDKKFKLGENLAYPIITLSWYNIGGEVKNFTEILDYNIDYKEGVVTLTNHLIKETGKGTILVEYNCLYGEKYTFPIDAKGEKLSVLGNNGDVRLDNQTEIFEIVKTPELVREYVLSLPCIDPLRHVRYNPVNNPDVWVELVEDTDYTVNYEDKTIQILNNDVLNKGYALSVNYTPAIFARSLILQYNLSRKNNDEGTNDDVLIHPNHIEYKS